MKRISFFLFLLFYLAACQSVSSNEKKESSYTSLPERYTLIDSLKPMIRNGDLVFRNGTDAVSRAARSMNRHDTSFSHCGLLYLENDSIMVYHAIGGAYNPGQRLKREWFNSFCNPEENDAIGIYRYPLSVPQQEKLETIVRTYYRAGLKFDLFFNFQSDDVMYCSEFVFKSLNQSMEGGLTKYLRLDTIPFGVTTDDLFLNENARLVKKQSFRK